MSYRNEQGAVLVITLIFAFIISLLGISYFRMGGLEGGIVHSRLSASQALYCADAGVDYAKFRLRDENQWVSSNWGNISVGSIGATEVQFVYSNGASEGRIVSTGTVGDTTRMIEAIITRTAKPGSLVNANSGGAPADWSNKFDLHLGVNIDGRNHDINGNVILDGSGTAALNIPEGVTITNTGCTLGGTVDGTDYAPLVVNDPSFNPDLIAQSSEGPSSPYELLGFASDAELILEAQKPGNTYYNVAAEGGPPTGTYVVSGLTYIDFAGYSGKWVDPSTTIAGGGILIIRGGIKYFKVDKMHIDFKGIFMGDNVELEFSSGRLLGALYLFNPSNKFEVSGPSDILFSREVMMGAFQDTGISPVGFGGSTSFGPRLTSWREL